MILKFTVFLFFLVSLFLSCKCYLLYLNLFISPSGRFSTIIKYKCVTLPFLHILQ